MHVSVAAGRLVWPVFALALALAAPAQEKPQPDKPQPTDAKDKTPSDFARFVAVGDGGHFDTAITTYRNDAGAEVKLFAAVHIADAALYAALQQRFTQCDALLYELVGPEDYRPVRGEGGTGSFISMLQTGLKNGLELEFQLDAIDYTAPNFVHADMTPDEFRDSMEERGETLFGMLLKVGMQSAQVGEGSQNSPLGVDLVKAFRNGEGRHRLRVAMASQLENMEAMVAGGKGSTLLEGRNGKCLQVLDRELAAGKKKIGIYYGAAHLTDMEQRLLAKGFHKVDHEWLQAWDCTPRPDPKVDHELWAQRRKARTELEQIAGAAKRWQEAHGGAPPTLDDLRKPGADGKPAWNGTGKDPWGRDYVLRVYPDTDGEAPEIDVQSLGQDGKDGGADDLHTLSPRELHRLQRDGHAPPPGLADLLDDIHKEARAVKLEKARIDVFSLRDVAMMYKIRENRWPTLKDLAKPDAHGQKYIEEIPLDPWGNDYELRPTADGKHIVVRSAGPDGVLETADDIASDGPSAKLAGFVVDESTPEKARASGKRLYQALCATCHTNDGTTLLGPSWKGIWGTEVEVRAGGQVVKVKVDADYVRESIRTPEKKKVVGFEDKMMTPFDERMLGDRQVRCLIEYIKSLADDTGGGGKK